MVVLGLATTVSLTVLESVVPGFQLNEVAPLAISVVLVPLHMDADDGVTVIVGVGLNVSVLVQLL